MTMMTIVREDGTTTIENMLTDIASMLTDDEQHEVILWSDGSLSLDSLVGESAQTVSLQLNLASVRQLRDFLTSAKVTAQIESAQ